MNLLNVFKDRWPNFSPEEIFSPESIKRPHVLCVDAMDALQTFRTQLERPLVVNFGSNRQRGVRTYEDNQAIGGAKDSMHLHGRAFDIHCPDISVSELYDKAKEFGRFKGLGLYRSWVHVDTRFSLDFVEWES